MNGWETARFGDPDQQQDGDRNWLPRQRHEEDPDDLRDAEQDRDWERRDRAAEQRGRDLGKAVNRGMALSAMLLGPPRGRCLECGEPDEMLTDAGHCGPCEVEIARDAVGGYKADVIADDLRQQGFEIE